jgi:hypothetical protein
MKALDGQDEVQFSRSVENLKMIKKLLDNGAYVSEELQKAIGKNTRTGIMRVYHVNELKFENT